ncbi:MAG: hypothetical protein AABY84_12615, partial [Candidatus Firestonebacteria bacterium]
MFILDVLHKVNTFAEKSGIKIYVVGGFIRDLLLERSTNDIDFVVMGNSINFAKKLANKLKASFFLLNEKHSAARIIYKSKNADFQLDFSPCRGKKITDDLAKRDFTINAIAIPL